MSAIATTLVLLVFAWGSQWLDKVTHAPSRMFYAGLLMLAPATIIGSLLLVRHGWRRFLAAAGLRHLFTYPPLWVASLGGVSAFAFIAASCATIQELLHLNHECRLPLMVLASTLSLTSLIALASATLVHRLRTSGDTSTGEQHEAASTKENDTDLLHGSFEQLKTWLANDDPIENDKDDVLGHREIANRIASRLLACRPSSQAVVGRLGSGKSSLLNLVQAALTVNPLATKRLHVVPVELWPFETTRAAVEGVISALIDALAKEVGVTALRGLPEAYATLMSSAGGLWSALAHLPGKTPSPTKLLQRIDTIATAIGHSYVVWVEDLERFAGTGSVSQESLDDAERLSPIRALLYGLDRLNSVAVITATTSLHVRFDIEKIARYVEELPLFPTKEAARIIAVVRRGCRQNFGVIDPVKPGVRKHLDQLDDDEYLDYLRKFPTPDSLCSALPLLCSTPRVLKQALRTALDTWERLPGEIDLDDLLAMSILRAAQPNAFAVLRQHVGALRWYGSVATERAKTLATLKAALDELQFETQTRQAIDQIITSVFDDDSRSDKKPQGLSNSRAVDYWERFLAVPTLSEGERDQTVMRVIEADDDELLLDLLEGAKSSDAVENLEHLIATDRLKRIFVPLVRRRSTEDPSQWHDDDPPGLIPLWRMWQRRSERGDLDAATVLDEVRLALDISVPQNLYLATRIEQFFVIPSSGVHDMLLEAGASRAQEAKSYLRELVMTTFNGKPEALARALKGPSHPTLLWVTWGIDRVRAGTMSGSPFASWPNLAETILEAARLQPAVLLPQIACLVARESVRLTDPGSLVHQYEFNQEAAENLFGDANAVLDAFERCDLSQWSDNRPVDAMLVALRSRASLSNQTTG